MKIFIIVRDDVTIANGVVFGPGAIAVHSLLRRDRDSLTRFPALSDVRQAYRDCKIQMVETAAEATYSRVARKARRQPPIKPSRRKTSKKVPARSRRRAPA